jgi:hypothetical protein
MLRTGDDVGAAHLGSREAFDEGRERPRPINDLNATETNRWPSDGGQVKE